MFVYVCILFTGIYAYIHTHTCIYFGRSNCWRKYKFIYIQNTLTYLYIHEYTYIYIHISTDVFCMYMVIYIVCILVVFCMYMYVYTYLHVFFARKVVSRIDTCIYVHIRIYVQNTSHILIIYISNTYKYIQYTYIFLRTRFFPVRILMYVYARICSK